MLYIIYNNILIYTIYIYCIASIEIMTEDETAVKKKRIAKPKLLLTTPPTVRSNVKKPEDFSSIDERSHTIFDIDDVPEVTKIPEFTVGNRLKSEFAENSQIELLKAQSAEIHEAVCIEYYCSICRFSTTTQ